MSRRIGGEGTIFRRADGRLVVELSVGPRGARRKLTEYAADEEDAIAKLERLRRQAGRLGPADPAVQTVGQFLNWWLEVELPARVADTGENFEQTTFDSYRVKVTKYLVPKLGHIRLSKLGPQHIRGMLREMAAMPGRGDKPLSPRTREYAHAILRSALACAVDMELIDRNPAALVKPPSVVRRRPPTLPEEHAMAIFKQVRDDRLEALWKAPITGGLRPGEARALCWDTIDLDQGAIEVRRSLARVTGGWLLKDTKSHMQRSVAIPGFAVDVLRAHRQAQLEERLRLGAAYTPAGLVDREGIKVELVFTMPDGRPLRPDWMEDELARICTRAGVPRLTPHQYFRHGGATLMLTMGTPLEVIREILGHSSLQVTEGYAHVLDSSKVAAADRWDRTFGQRAQ